VNQHLCVTEQVELLCQKASLNTEQASKLFAAGKHLEGRAALMRALYASDQIKKLMKPKRNGNGNGHPKP
jgi:hypothetical protein